MIPRFAGAERATWALLRHPAHLLLGSATLALAVGIFFATFALVDALVFTPPAFKYSRDVVLYGEIVRPLSPRNVSATVYNAVGLPPGVLSRGLARAVERAGVRGGDHAAVLAVQRVDPGFLPTLGVEPAEGSLVLEQAGRDGLLVSWRLWQAWFAGDRAALGREIYVDGRPLPVVGVLPSTYRLFDDVDILLPLRTAPGAAAAVPNYLAVARLAPGASVDGMVTRVQAAAGRVHGKDAARRFGITPLDDALTEASAPALWLLLGCAALVLATACGNLANLMLARALGRSQETALRRALGAGFWDSWATAAIEALSMGVIGLAAGCLLGHALVRAGENYIPDAWRIIAGALTIGPRVYVASTLVAFVVVGLAAVGGTLHEQGDALLRDYIGGGRPPSERVTAGRIRVAMVQFQLALATVLLSLCVVRGMQAWRMQDVLPGFDAADATAARFRPDPGHLNGIDKVAGAVVSIEQRAARLPRVVSAGVTTQLPFGTSFSAAFAAPGGRAVETQFVLHTPGARGALGMRLIAGRDITMNDTASAPAVLVVNQAFLDRIPGASLGGMVRKVSQSLGERDLRIVGIVANTRDAGPAEASRPWAIAPFGQLPQAEFESYRSLLAYYLVLRGKDAAVLTGSDAVEAMHEVAPWLVLERPRSLARVWRDSPAEIKRDTWLSTLFASVGLGLGLVGMYSAQRVEVASRRRDLGLCVALGATPLDMLGMCIARGVARASLGVSLGLAAALAWSRWPPTRFAPALSLDMGTALIVAVGMLVLTTAVALPPAWHSATTPPWLVLRNA
ncbi:MAG: ABC transporter permease [Luteibacter sp.]